MKIISSIETLLQLLDKNLPKKSKTAGITLYTIDLYNGPLLSIDTKERVQASLRKKSLIEIQFSEEEMLHYHQAFTRCDQYRCLTFEDFVAVAYAKSEGYILLAEKGFLSRYALSMNVEVMSLREFEEHCLQRQRQVCRRKEHLKAHFSNQEKKNTPEEEPMQQSIDDDTTL